ncbi:MAG: HAD family hydrolase [bacterium]
MRAKVKAVLFDMDGTITQPYIDWVALRERLGMGTGGTIMGYIEGLSGEARRRALEILEGAEGEAAVNSELRPGAREVLRSLTDRGIRTCIVTNNSRRSADIVLRKHGLRVDLVLTREDGRPKPEGDLLVRACEVLDVSVGEVIFVGDGRLDTEAGRKVGMRTLILGDELRCVGELEHISSLEDLLNLRGIEC